MHGCSLCITFMPLESIRYSFISPSLFADSLMLLVDMWLSCSSRLSSALHLLCRKVGLGDKLPCDVIECAPHTKHIFAAINVHLNSCFASDERVLCFVLSRVPVSNGLCRHDTRMQCSEKALHRSLGGEITMITKMQCIQFIHSLSRRSFHISLFAYIKCTTWSAWQIKLM